jgi:hypothetical protein
MWWVWLPLAGVGVALVAALYLVPRYGRPLSGTWPPG